MFLSSWSRRKRPEGNSFDDEFQIDGAPLWWFFERMFVSHILPRQINLFHATEKRQNVSLLQKFRYEINAYVVRHLILLNEKRKLNFFRDEQKSSNSEKVLFLSYSGHILPDGTLFRIQKIIDLVKTSSPLEPFVLFADPLSSRNYKKLKGRKTIYNYQSRALENEARSISARLDSRWNSLSAKEKSEMLMHGDFSYWPYLKYAFDVFFSKGFLFLLSYYYMMAKEALVKENIKVVVLTSQNSIFDKCLIAAAQKLRLPVLRIQHGIGEGLNPYYATFDRYYKLIFSESVKADLMTVGWPEKNLIVVGPVIFDAIATYARPKDRPGKTVLIATAPLITESGGEKKYFSKIEMILKQICSVEHSEIILKLHPAEIPSDSFTQKYMQCARKAGAVIKILSSDVTREQFYRAIQRCDVFVNFGSTAALEAMIIGRPVLTLKMIDFPSMTGWMEKNHLALVISSEGNITKAIELILENRDDYSLNVRRYVEKKCGRLDGKAYKKVVQAITDFYRRTNARQT